MAKDPAFLFYPGDWLGGTMGMTLEQKGGYLELLIFQFNNGPFTEAQAQQVLSICFASVWQVLSKKFTKQGNLYLNTRLRDEIEKRKKFSESRRNNAKGHKKTEIKPKAYAKHMENENEDINNKIKESFDSMYLDQEKTKWAHIDFDFEYRTFCDKVRGSPEIYTLHKSLRLAFQAQLRAAKSKPKAPAKEINPYAEAEYNKSLWTKEAWEKEYAWKLSGPRTDKNFRKYFGYGELQSGETMGSNGQY